MPSRVPFDRTQKQTTTERGYGWRHQQMRRAVLLDEPLCRICLTKDPPLYTPSTIADHIKPLAEGGTGDRDNYQGLCADCSDEKTQDEAARARGARAPKRTVTIGDDGWPST